jgi:hypothetical protein
MFKKLSYVTYEVFEKSRSYIRQENEGGIEKLGL